LAVGGYYGTSVFLHEVVELRILLSRDPGLLQRGYDDIDAFLQANQDAHVQALAVEYDYLRRKLPWFSTRSWDVGNWCALTLRLTISGCFSSLM
jgi:hypothetical protein